eukprot:5048546-Prymnesium_polylepis.1
MPRPDDEYDIFNEEVYEVALLRHKHVLRRLRAAFPEMNEDHHTASCFCGHGALPVAMGGPK